VPVSPGKNDLSVISLKDDVESSEVVVTYVAPPAPPELLDNRLSEDGQSILIRGRSPSRDARIVATCGTIEKSTISKPDRSFALPFPVAPGENHIKVRAFLEDEGLDGSRPVELTVVGPPPPPVVIEKILSPNGRDVVLVVRSAPGTSVNVVVPGVAVPAILEPVEGSFRSDPLPLHGGENSFYLRTLQGSQRSRATTCVVVIEE